MRKKADDTASGSTSSEAKDSRTPVKVDLDQNPSWWVPVMLGLMLAGLAWLVTYYLSNFSFPIKSIGKWNMGIGFALILAGFFMTTRWK